MELDVIPFNKYGSSQDLTRTGTPPQTTSGHQWTTGDHQWIHFRADNLVSTSDHQCPREHQWTIFQKF